jgi:putative copper resistance protein D
MSRLVRGSAAGRALALLVLLLLGLPVPALAHGPDPGPPDVSLIWTGWSFHVEVWLPILLAGWGYRAAMRHVNAAHPANPVPRYRWWAWLGGLAALILALASPIERYDTTLFSVHMVQHMLLAFAAAPLLVLAAPVTLLLRVATPNARRRIILPVLHSRVMNVLANPFVTWGLFALVMWGSHFSPLFDAALEDPFIHLLEHGLFLSTAMLFWYPVIGADPGPYRMAHPARLGYLGLGMPFGSFLGLAIFSATTVLYPHYATSERTWGPSPLEDQALAGGLMWAVGDGVFIVALVLAVVVWLRAEEVKGRQIDEQLDREERAEARRVAARDVAGAPEGP